MQFTNQQRTTKSSQEQFPTTTLQLLHQVFNTSTMGNKREKRKRKILRIVFVGLRRENKKFGIMERKGRNLEFEFEKESEFEIMKGEEVGEAYLG